MAKFLSNTTNLIAKFSVLFGILFLATFLYANSAVAASADFVDTLIEDMGENEATLMNAPDTGWSKRAYLDMGFAARGDATPSMWADAQGGQYTSSEPWRTILPWFQIWPVEGNSGVSTVQVSNIQVQMLIGGTWETLELEPEQWGQLEPWNLIGGKGEVQQTEVEEGVYQYVIDNSGPVHGGLGRHELSALGIDPTAIEGVAISAVAEIVDGDGEILFEIGGDYHPNMEVQVEDFALQWGPAVGGSKFGIIDGARCIYMTTIDPPGADDSAYSGKRALTHDELRANPPEDLCDGAGSSKRPKIEFTAEESGRGNSVELTWDVENADTCKAAEGTPSWSGEVETSGSQFIEDVENDTRFGLVCEGNGFKTRKSVSVTAAGEVIDDGGDEDGDGRHFENSEDGDGRGDYEEESGGSESESESSSDDSGSDSGSDTGSGGGFGEEAKQNMVRILNLLVEKLLQLLDLYQRLLGL